MNVSWSLFPEVTDTVQGSIANVSSVQWVQLHEQLEIIHSELSFLVFFTGHTGLLY